MSFTISAIICTYNPSEHIFGPCLDALSAALQTAPIAEVLIIDNNSSFALEDQGYIHSFLARHANARVIREMKQGLTPARIRGIREAESDILVFIDDDNIIKPDFLREGARIAREAPHIGSWSGQVHLRFEAPPPEWTRRYWGMLVYRPLDRDVWSNLPHLGETMPCGAGLFVRRAAAAHYLRLHDEGARDIQLDRSGSSLFSGGDNDLAACACDIGLGVGLFRSLEMDHYIPEKRTSEQYLLSLTEGIAASAIVFRSFRGELPEAQTPRARLANAVRSIMKKGADKKFFEATLRGEAMGRELLARKKRNG